MDSQRLRDMGVFEKVLIIGLKLDMGDNINMMFGSVAISTEVCGVMSWV